MKRGLVRFLCVMALGLALFDAVADAGCCDDAKSATVACHACCCGPRVAPQGSVKIAAAPIPSAYASYEMPAYFFLPPQSIFHPPCLAA